MYGATIPEDEVAEATVSKQPSKNQASARRFGLVVALCVGVVIGALGTMALVAGGPEAPSPSRAAMELDAQSECDAAVMKYLDGSDSLSVGDCHDLAKSCWF